MDRFHFLAAVIFSILAVQLTTSETFASPHHIIMKAKRVSTAAETAMCTYPDGTHPTNSEIHCYTPQQFLAAYQIDQVHAMGLTGKGQTIILVDSFGSPTAQADLDHFSDTFGLPRTTIQFVYPNGPYINPMQNDDQAGWAGETTLDLQWAHAVAPDATIVNVVTSSSETTGLNGFPDIFAGIQMAIQKYPNAIVSMSFGTGEPTFAASDIQNYVTSSFHQVFAAGQAAGITFLASAGDQGSTNINSDQTSLLDYPNAGYPASDPLVTAVGGTALETGWRWTPQGTADDYWNCKINKVATCPTDFLHSDGDDGKIRETVWKEDWAVAGGGGGVSTLFSEPAYQSNSSSLEKLDNVLQGHRGMPDVALNAAINGGVDVYTSYGAPGATAADPQWQSFGGTSCASPETAGIVALALEKASETLGQPVGFGDLNSLIYSLDDDDFHDVRSHMFGADHQVLINNNSIYFSATALQALGPAKIPPTAVAGFPTTRGYDLASGRGSPKAVKFVLDLARARVKRR